MNSKYTVIIKNNVLQYQFEIRKKVTILKGDSATGKTVLVNMIREYERYGESSGIYMKCDKACGVLDGTNWKIALENTDDFIFFIDEGNSFIFTDEFSDAVKKSNNYFVLITRESLPKLENSNHEIYGIRSLNRNNIARQIQQEFYLIEKH